jgi:hypothetical protein
MGTWGIGLYSDDTACDVRDDYKDILGDGISEPEATKRIVEQWKNELSDPDVGPVFWLTLADTQWNLGRLQERIKQEAILVIENDTDLVRWFSDQKLVNKRKLILERLKQKLETAQPPEKKVRKRYVDSTDWDLGDIYSFRLKSGKLVLLHVIGFHQDKGGRFPVCEILDWNGEKIPDKKEIEKMGYIFAKKPYQHLCQFMFGSLGPKDFHRERIDFVAKNVRLKQKPGGYTVIFWRSIDTQFKEFFELE